MKWPTALAVAVAVVVAGCGGATKTVTLSTPVPPGASPTTTATAAPTAGAVTGQTGQTGPGKPHQPVVHTATFKSPSANIGCMIIAGTARCDIKQRTWSPPLRPTSCPTIVDFGQGLLVTGSGTGRLVCAGDTTLDPSAQALAYGSATVVGSFRCSSATTGVTCTNTKTAHGFFISIGSYRVF